MRHISPTTIPTVNSPNPAITITPEPDPAASLTDTGGAAITTTDGETIVTLN